MKQNNSPHLKDIRKTLRSHCTIAEATLWNALKNKKLDGWRWRRQFSIGNIILDFYCPKAKLGIELNGNHHYTAGGQIADEIKIEQLNDLGIKVIHVENQVFWDTPDLVLELIRQELNKTRELGDR